MTTPHTAPKTASLSVWLRERSDDALAALLRRRPDLCLPAPADIATLASRLSVRSSVQRAVDALDSYTLRVLEAAVLCAHENVTTEQEIRAAVRGADPAAGLATLGELGLLWDSGQRLHLVANVTDAVGPYPAGLGRPYAQLLRGLADAQLTPVLQNLGLAAMPQPAAGNAVRMALSEPGRLAEVLDECGPSEREVLQRLADGPPVGVVRNAFTPIAITDAASPPHRLIARGLLVAIDMQTVELPREVALHLRGGLQVELTGLAPTLATREVRDLDRVAATNVLETLRLVERLGESWTRHPPAVLRTGGIGTRELKRTARELDVSETTAALLIEVAAAAGLLSTTSAMSPLYLPSAEFDHWLAKDPAPRWCALATAWCAMTRQPSLVNQRDERDRLISALGPGAERGTAPATRRATLAVLAELAAGSAPASPEEVLIRLQWLSPRRAGSLREINAATLTEAETLGVTGAGGITGFGRALLAGSQPEVTALLASALPAPIDSFLLQPDLTAVVPGPPTMELATTLAETADLESSGGASVYRVTEATLRRALDTGWTSAELADFFTNRSRTPVPQALSYLIEDISRRYGVLRAGVASSYLRCEDEALLSRVVLDEHLRSLDLRRLAATVAISSQPVATVVEVLRKAGYTPSGEGNDGGVLDLRRDPPRAPARPARTARVRSSTVNVEELVRRLRTGDTLAEVSKRVQPTGQRIPGVTTAATLGLLRDAIRAGDTVWLGYVDTHGTASQHTIMPISMAGGTLRGHDTTTGALEAFALHHITSVGLVAD